MVRKTLPKSARLTSRKVIALLNDKEHNNSLHQYPILLAWIRRPDNDPPPVRVLFTVSRRHFKNASDRNRIKRLLRECYRYRMDALAEQLRDREPIALMFVYIGKEVPDSPYLRQKFNQLFDTFLEHIGAHA